MKNQITQEACARADEFLDLFCALAQRHQLYGPRHPRTQASWKEFAKLTAELRGLVPNDRLVIGYTEKRFYLENVPLRGHRRHTHLLQESLRRRGLGGFILSLAFRELPAEILSLVAREKPTPDEEIPEGFRWLTKEERERAGTGAYDGSHVLLNLENSRINVELYDEALSAVTRFFAECARCMTGDIAPVVDIADQLVEEVLTRPQEILPRATVPYYAEFSSFHAVNTCLYSVAAARHVVNDRRMLKHLATAALVHDIGEALIPLKVMYKSEPLTPTEARLIMEHPLKGVEIFQEIPGIHPIVISATFGHHVKGNGAGYPEVGPEYEPGPFTRLLQVVDIFSALLGFRPHKRAITAPQAFARIYSDPGLAPLSPLVDLLVHAIGFHPPGSRVRFETGEVAIVRGHRDDPLRPVVQLLQKGEDGSVSLGAGRQAAAGDVPWFKPPKDAPVIRALDPLEDLDLMTSLKSREVLDAAFSE